MKIGTRKSQLAVIQTELVMDAIKAHFPSMNVEITGCDTKGDRQLNRPLSDFGGKGAFTRDIELAILEGRIDMAVHSAKDMPLELPEGLMVGAVLAREDSRDVWVSCRKRGLKECPEGTIAGTGSRRRAMQAMEMNQNLIIKDIRGNVPTRLRKLSEGQYDGIILAAAGLIRLGHIKAVNGERGSFCLNGEQFYYEYLPEDEFLPAAGQGIIAVEMGRNMRNDVMETIHHEETGLLFTAERAFLNGIGGGCNEAAAISAKIKESRLCIKAKYAGVDDRMRTVTEEWKLTESRDRNRQIAAEAGQYIAERLIGQEEHI